MARPIFRDRVRMVSTIEGTGTLTLTSSVVGYASFEAVGNGNQCYYAIVHEAMDQWEVGLGTYTSSGTTLSRDEVLASSNAGAAVSFSAGDKDVFVVSPAQRQRAAELTFNDPCGLRLTTATATPNTADSRTSQGSIYLTPDVSNRVLIPNTTAKDFDAYELTEQTYSVSGSSGSNYDLFLWASAGTPTIQRSAAWSSDTGRNDAITTLHGVVVNSGTIGSMPASRGLWLGCFRCSGANVIDDSFNKRFLFSNFNRRLKKLRIRDSSDNWNHTLTTFRKANNSATNRVEFLRGDDKDMLHCSVFVDIFNTTSAVNCSAGIGLDDDTNIADVHGGACPAAGFGTARALYSGSPGLGYHYLQWLEASDAAGTTFWYGDNGGSLKATGMFGFINC
jgi:hypothetical protein